LGWGRDDSAATCAPTPALPRLRGREKGTPLNGTLKMNTSQSQTRSKPIWSLELVLVVALPILAVLGCAATLYLALSMPAHESVVVDRFGHVVNTAP
jgi:hypothetical protein